MFHMEHHTIQFQLCLQRFDSHFTFHHWSCLYSLFKIKLESLHLLWNYDQRRFYRKYWHTWNLIALRLTRAFHSFYKDTLVLKKIGRRQENPNNKLLTLLVVGQLLLLHWIIVRNYIENVYRSKYIGFGVQNFTMHLWLEQILCKFNSSSNSLHLIWLCCKQCTNKGVSCGSCVSQKDIAIPIRIGIPKIGGIMVISL